MAFPEKERKDDPNFNDPPKKAPDTEGDPAVTPDEIHPYEVFQEIDKYQRKIEQEWDQAKESYQKKIDGIMSDFLKENRLPFSDEKSPPPSPKKTLPKQPPSKPKKPLFAPPPGDVGKAPEFDALMINVQKTLKRLENNSKYLTYSRPPDSPVINVDMRFLRSPVKRKIFWIFSSCTLFVGICFSTWYYRFTVPFSSPLPYSHTSNLIIQDDKIYIVDWFRRDLYIHQKTRHLPILKVETLPNSFTSGMAITSDSLLSLNSFDKEIIEHSLSKDHRVIKKNATPGNNPAGLFWDGRDLWTYDNVEQKLFQLYGRDISEVKKVYTAQTKTVSDFVIQNKRVWVLNTSSREIYIYRLQEPLKLLTSIDLDPLLDGAIPTGLHIDEKNAWLVTEEPAKLLRIPLRKLRNHQSTTF